VTLAPDGKTGYLTDGGANKILIFDVASLKVTGEVPTGGENPDALVLDPATGLLFTFNGKQGVAIDIQQKKVVGTIPVPGKPEFAQADGEGHVFVNVETTNQLLRIDSRTRKVTASWKLTGCEGPSGLALDKTHRRLFSVCDGKMAVTDAVSGKQVALVSVGDGPDAVWYDSKHSLVFASNGGPGTLSIIAQKSPNEYTLQQTVKTIPGARTMALDETTGTAYVITPQGQKGTATGPKHLMIDVITP
jgi:YVTN family beta-propeller protein